MIRGGAFVFMLFITAIDCFLIAIAGASWGLLIGGIVLLCVAISARRQYKKEQETGPEAFSPRFFAIAMLVTILAIYFLYWLQTYA
jgi:hypothetical protein